MSCCYPLVLSSSSTSPSYSSSLKHLSFRCSSINKKKKNTVYYNYKSSGVAVTFAGITLTLIRFRPFVIPTYNTITTTTHALPSAKEDNDNGDQEEEESSSSSAVIILSSCLVGLLTGIGVVLFNNSVHEIRDLTWDGIPYRGASWLREEPVQSTWTRVILVPTFGGLLVGLLNLLRDNLPNANKNAQLVRLWLQPLLKTLAACLTLGTGNSLGPEGPSVEIGASIGKAISSLSDNINITNNLNKNNNSQRLTSLLASGSAAGISSGFNAAVSGCFFAVESVLWPSPSTQDSSLSLTNTTSMVILSSVIASVVSQVGLGSEPAFKVPEYDFRSPGELPLYLLLGIICGVVSWTLSKCTTYLLLTFDDIQKNVGVPRAVFPALGGLATGIIALAYPEILYWGFENVDILLESRPFVKGLSAELLLQLVAVKIAATSLCRASGLVGGYYAPSLFIGAATGMAYGKLVSFAVAQAGPSLQLSILEVASPQAYGLVGMAATLAGVCQVPLTAVLLLFELTQDYRIVLPLLGAVGFSSWITSGQTRRQDARDGKKFKAEKAKGTQPTEQTSGLVISDANDLCEIESSLCMDDSMTITGEYMKTILVSEAMRTRYVTVFMSTSLAEAINLMLTEKQSCAVIVDDKNILVGLLTLGDIQEFSKFARGRSDRPEELSVSEICSLDNGYCHVTQTTTPGMDLLSAERIMNKHGMNHIPVVSEHIPVGLLDRECISLASRALATRESLSQNLQSW